MKPEKPERIPALRHKPYLTRSVRGEFFYIPRSVKGEFFYTLRSAEVRALTSLQALVEYLERVPATPLNPEAAVEEGVKLAERLNRERLGGEGKILGVRKSAEGEEYAIYMEVPLEIYENETLVEEVEVESIRLSDRLGVPFFLYLVPPGYFG